MTMNRNDYLAKKLSEKRRIIKEMAKEFWLKSETNTVANAVRAAKTFYDNIESELNKALEKDGNE